MWRRLERPGCRVGSRLESALRQSPEGMAPERYCLCLAVLREAGLLETEGDALYGAKAAAVDGKADLEATELMQLLHSC